MDKRIKQTIIILALAAIGYTVLVFAFPFRICAALFISYAFELIAIGLMIPVFKTAFGNAGDIKSKIYGFPIARIGYIYLGLQTAVSLIIISMATVFESFPVWIPIVVCSLILVLALIGCIASDIAREEIEKIEVSQKADTGFIREMRVKSKNITGRTADSELKKQLEALEEAFRFSDPVSCEAIRKYEDNISAKFSILEEAVSSGNVQKALSLCAELQQLLSDRNTACKGFKHEK